MSEEALESRNKDIRNYREFFSRKNGRINNIKDIFNHLMITSDPNFDQFRVFNEVSKGPNSPDMVKVLQNMDMDIADYYVFM